MIPGGVSVQIWPATQTSFPHAKGPPASAQSPHVHFCVPLSHVAAPQKQSGMGPVQTSHEGVGGGQVHVPPMQRARGP
jgi:hypothetical protein